MAVKQTAGRERLGTFAPKFAALHDNVLFGEVWSREQELSLRDRSLVTVTALMARPLGTRLPTMRLSIMLKRLLMSCCTVTGAITPSAPA